MVLALTSVFLAGCNYRREKGRGPNQISDGDLFARIQTTIIQPKCVDCHASANAGNRGVDLSSHQRMLETKSVVPGRPDDSSFYTTILNGSMPKGGPALGEADKRLVKAWIESGAKLGAPPAAAGPGKGKGDEEKKGEEPRATANAALVATFSSIRDNIFQAKCSRCHNPERRRAGVDLSSVSSIITSVGDTMRPLTPGNPEASGIYDQIVGAQKMPPGPVKLTPEEAKVIYDWIQEGANDN